MLLTPMSPQNGEMMETAQRGVAVDRAQGSPRALPLGGLLGRRTGVAHETRGPLRPLRLLRGPQFAGAGRGETGGREVIDVDADPPHASAAGSSIKRLRIAARRTGEVASVLGKRKAAGPARIVGAAARRQFPAASELGQWVRERLQTGEWDAWLCSLRACLPRAPPGLLERRLLQFLEWGSEAARDLRQPDFLRVLAVALSSFSPEVWEPLLHDSTSPKLLMQRIREEVLAQDLGLVGRVHIPRGVWDRCVPDSFADLAGRQFSGLLPPSDEAVVMMRALRGQGLLFPLPPGSLGPNGGVFAIPKTEEKCSLIVNLVPLNEEMRSRPEKFSLPSVEVLALLAQVAQQGSSFFLPSFYARARCMRPVWDVLSLPGGGG